MLWYFIQWMQLQWTAFIPASTYQNASLQFTVVIEVLAIEDHNTKEHKSMDNKDG